MGRATTRLLLGVLGGALLCSVACPRASQDAGPRPRAADASPMGDGAAPPDGGGVEDACVTEARAIGTMVALGSSTVAGSGASDEAHRFVNLVAAAIGAETLLNLGAGGQRAEQVVGALAEQARAARPDVVVVLAFTDYASSDGTRMAEAWRQVLQPIAEDGARVFFGDVRIDPAWVCSAQPTPTGACYEPAEAEMIAAKNAIVAQVLGPIANLALVPVLDDSAAHPEWQTADGHPNDLGHANLAQVYLEAMQPALQRRRCGEDAG